MAPTRPVPGVTLSRPTAKEFECLEEGDDQLWQARIRRTDSFRDALCPPIATLDVRAKPIPIMFAFWAKHGMDNNPALNMVALAANTAARFNADVIVLLLHGRPNRPHSSPRHITKADLPVQLRPNVRVVAAATWDETNPISLAFRSFGPKQYQHHSTNGYEYELYCFQRWFAMITALDQLGYKEVFAVDNDVLVLTNITREMEQCYAGCESAGHLIYAQHFRLPVLRRFLDFVLDFYGHSQSGSSRGHTVESTVARYTVVSDMYLHVLFNESELKHNRTTRTRQCSAQSHSNVRAPEPYQVASPFYGDLAHGYLQDDLGLLLLQREWPHSVRGHWTLAPSTGATHAPTGQPRLMQVAHFQGPPNKKIMLRCAEGVTRRRR